MKAVLGYTAAILIFQRFIRLCMGKNNVDFKRLIREDLDINLIK